MRAEDYEIWDSLSLYGEGVQKAKKKKLLSNFDH